MSVKDYIQNYDSGVLIVNAWNQIEELHWDKKSNSFLNKWLGNSAGVFFNLNEILTRDLNHITILDYYIPELMNTKESLTNKEVCKCDFYTVILVTGCICGGK